MPPMSTHGTMLPIQEADSAHEGWKMMPHLFDTWDIDNSGAIDRYELTAGMGRLIGEHVIGISLQDVYDLMEEVDLNDDKQLDRREFGCFLSRIAAASKVSLDVLTFALVKQQEAEAKKRLDRILKSQDIDTAHEGWQMMPLLFDTWDVDNSGTIDKRELQLGMSRFIKENHLAITMKDVFNIMQEVDLNNDSVLDRREFGCFLSRVSSAANISLDGMTRFLMRQREAEAKKRLEVIHKESPSLEKAWVDMPRLFSMWDKDKNGTIDRGELAVAVNRYLCASKNDKLSLTETLFLMDEVDMDDDRVLDLMEFGAFMSRFSLSTGVPLEELMKFFLDDRREGMGKSRSLRGTTFSNFFARATVSLAEESAESIRRTSALD